jgi:hypothetical protein
MSRQVVRFGPLLFLINMYVATVLVTNPMMGSFLCFSEGVSEALRRLVPVGCFDEKFSPLCPSESCFGCLSSEHHRGVGPGWVRGVGLVSTSCVNFRWRYFPLGILVLVCPG